MVDTITSKLVANTYIPKMFTVRQIFDKQHMSVAQIPKAVAAQLAKPEISKQIAPGMEIAITAGSRGIANIALITKSIVDYCLAKGAKPFIVPAMGSHGGATAEGQQEILHGYGITQEAMGCPIRSSMEVQKIGVNEDGMDVLIDKHAANADGIIVACRIKPHTAFRGPYESGIMKMLTIGLGKQAGAEVCHEAGFKHMAKYVPMFGKAIIKHAPIICGLATIENAFDETLHIEAVNAPDIETREPELLKLAFSKMPRIYVDECDVLVVDHIGKNFSGDGMDPNITGTFCSPYASGGIKSQRVAVLNLSPETHGNAIGIGFSSATTRRVFNQLDFGAMYPNAITCTVLGGVRIPIVMENDKECIQVCLRSCNEINKKSPRIVRIPNSLHLGHIMLSESYYEEAAANPNLEIISEPAFLPFDINGNIL